MSPPGSTIGWLPFSKGDDFRFHFSAATKRFFFPHMTVHLAPKSNDLCKFSIVISKKASKKAVSRNRYRRQLKEWYRTHCLHEFGHDIIIVAKAKLTPQPATTIHHDFSRVHRWLKTHCTIDWFLIKLTNYYSVIVMCATQCNNKRETIYDQTNIMLVHQPIPTVYFALDAAHLPILSVLLGIYQTKHSGPGHLPRVLAGA